MQYISGKKEALNVSHSSLCLRPSPKFLQTLSRSRPSFAFVCSPSLSFFPSLQSLPFPWRPCKEFQLEEFTPPPQAHTPTPAHFNGWREKKKG